MWTSRKAPTTARGLGHDHRQRKAALPDPSGQPCPFCHQPMWPGQSPTRNGRMLSDLEADHVIPRALGGEHSPLRWAHRTCNRSAGATLGNQLRRGTYTVRSRDWT